jgi:hypothetical protein
MPVQPPSPPQVRNHLVGLAEQLALVAVELSTIDRGIIHPNSEDRDRSRTSQLLGAIQVLATVPCQHKPTEIPSSEPHTRAIVSKHVCQYCRAELVQTWVPVAP